MSLSSTAGVLKRFLAKPEKMNSYKGRPHTFIGLAENFSRTSVSEGMSNGANFGRLVVPACVNDANPEIRIKTS